MSPEPAYYLNKLRAALTERIVNEDLAEVQQQALKAASQRNWDIARTSQEKSQSILVDSEKLNQMVDDLIAFFDEHPDFKKDLQIPEFLKARLENEPIPPSQKEALWYEPVEPTTSSDEENETQVNALEEFRVSQAEGFFYFVRKDKAGNFIFPTIKRVVKALIPEEKQENKDFVNDMIRKLSITRKNILGDLINTEYKTMTEFVSARLSQRGARDEWQPAWEYVAREYANYTPEEFAINVLLRSSRPTVVEERKKKFEEKRQRIFKEKYISNARPIALTLLIDRNAEGNFVYDMRDVENFILRDELKTDKNALTRAHMNIANAKWNIKAAVRDHPDYETMREFISDAYGEDLSGAENEEWKKFYEKILADYSEMSPQKFVDTILYRGRDGKLTTQEIDIKGETYDKIKETNLKNIGPVHEITLYRLLIREGAIDQIEELLGEPIEDALEKGRWDKCLEQSADVASKKHFDQTGHREIRPKESKRAREFVENFIRDLARNKEKYNEIMTVQGIHAFKFIYCVVPSLSAENIQKLIDIFFPQGKEYWTTPDGIILGEKKRRS